MIGPNPFPGGAQYASVTLNGSGDGTAQLGPSRVREHWQIAAVGVSVATDNAEASCAIYIGSAIGGFSFVGNTATGSSGDTCGCGGFDIQPGQFVFAVWEGGDPQEQATMAIFGTYTIGSPQVSQS
jgi:hypothetical protein